jgi:hypothetical protein
MSWPAADSCGPGPEQPPATINPRHAKRIDGTGRFDTTNEIRSFQ